MSVQRWSPRVLQLAEQQQSQAVPLGQRVQVVRLLVRRGTPLLRIQAVRLHNNQALAAEARRTAPGHRKEHQPSPGWPKPGYTR